MNRKHRLGKRDTADADAENNKVDDEQQQQQQQQRLVEHHESSYSPDLRESYRFRPRYARWTIDRVSVGYQEHHMSRTRA